MRNSLKKLVLVTPLIAASIALTAVPATASVGSGHYTSGNALSSRCVGSYLGGGNWQPLCLFYSHDGTEAIWGHDGSISNLAGYTFMSDGSTGSGQYVKNNATAMEVEYDEGCGGTVWFNSGWQGNYDWTNDGEAGPLYYTWNNDASTEVCHP